MKNKALLSAAAIAAVLLLTSCGKPAETTAVTAAPETAVTTAATTQSEIAPDGSLYVDFANGAAGVFECSDGWSNGSVFNVTWRKENVTFNDGKMQLIIDKDSKPKTVPYSGGEYRSRGFYGYGLYEVSMKAIKNDGVVSSFFTYTGPSDNNPWDEIDVEILGKDTTMAQFNYFTNGQGGHEYMHELGFDAADDFHTYGFDWQSDKITWYVDGAEVHSADKKIPVTESKIMMNAWCGTGVDDWLKAFSDADIPLTAEYEWIRFTPAI